jgi:hypothetical protein
MLLKGHQGSQLTGKSRQQLEAFLGDRPSKVSEDGAALFFMLSPIA